MPFLTAAGDVPAAEAELARTITAHEQRMDQARAEMRREEQAEQLVLTVVILVVAISLFILWQNRKWAHATGGEFALSGMARIVKASRWVRARAASIRGDVIDRADKL